VSILEKLGEKEGQGSEKQQERAEWLAVAPLVETANSFPSRE
jgi:hypothetical protein